MTIRRTTEKDDKKELDGKMVLRAFAFSNIKLTDCRPPLKRFLNRDIVTVTNSLGTKSEANVRGDDRPKLRQLEDEFRRITKSMVEVFGDNTCRE